MPIQKDPERYEVKSLRQYSDLAGKTVLEAGCGDGRLTWRYANLARHVVGIDVDRDGLRLASIERPYDLAEVTVFARADSVHLPFRDEAFDTTILSWSF